MRQKKLEKIPLKRFGRPGDVAGMVSFLCLMRLLSLRDKRSMFAVVRALAQCQSDFFSL